MLFVVLPVFKRMLVLFALIAIGFIGGKTKILSLEGNKSLSKLVNNITNPCSVLYSALCSEHLLSNSEVVQLLGIAVMMFVFLIVIAQFVPKLLRVSQDQADEYKFMMIFSNLGYMGIPVVSSVFGSGTTICVSIFIMVFYFFIYTYGICLIRGTTNKKKIDFKVFFTPMMISSVVSIICYLLRIRVSGVMEDILSTLRNVTTPCAMLIVGCALSAVRMRNVFLNWRLYCISLFKLLLIPLSMLFLIKLLCLESITVSILIIVMAMPVASNFSMLSAQYDRDQTLAASSIFITTLLSVFTIPLLAGILMM